MSELYKESVSEQDYETRCKGETASELLLLKSIRERERERESGQARV